MSSKNFLETLYESGISPRELLHLYISESHEQVWDEGLREMFERRVLNTLVSGEYLALGYSADLISKGDLPKCRARNGRKRDGSFKLQLWTERRAVRVLAWYLGGSCCR